MALERMMTYDEVYGDRAELDLAETNGAVDPHVDLDGEHHVDHRDGGDGEDDLGGRQGSRKPSQSTELVKLALERYRFGQSMAGEPFATAQDGPYIARLLRGGRDSLRAELSSAYADSHGRVPTSSALTDAMLMLQGRAQQMDAVDLHLRVADHGDGVVVDLGDPTGRAVVVADGRWQVVDRSPVLFRRSELTGTLPVPIPGGSLATLQKLLNVAAESWDLLVAALVSYFLARIPHPVLNFRGEHGTGKTTAARLLARAIDPSPAQVRSAPRDLDQWSTAASGSWVVVLDNVSTIQPWLSDAICRAVTGDGLVKRTLYSDAGLTVLSYRRVIMLTSIDAGSLRGDLADRLLLAELERIPDNRRLLDADVDAAFAAAHPRILGALLDLLAQVMVVLPTIKLAGYPRMADFARVVAAVDEVRGTKALASYMGTRDRLAAEVVEGDPVADAIRRFTQAHAPWIGSARQLLEAINADNADHPRTDWPTTAQGMSGALRRCSPALRSVGVDVDHLQREPGTGARRFRLDTQPNVTNVTHVITAGRARDEVCDIRDVGHGDRHGEPAGQGLCDVRDIPLPLPSHEQGDP